MLVRAAEVTLEHEHDCVLGHRLEQVRVGTRRNALEEAAADDAATLAEAIEERPRVRDHSRLVEEDPSDRLVPREDRREQCTASAGDVDNAAEASEVVGIEHR